MITEFYPKRRNDLCFFIHLHQFIETVLSFFYILSLFF